MSSFPRRLLRAALLDAEIYEEVEADRSSIGQAFTVVLGAGVAIGLGRWLQATLAGVEVEIKDNIELLRNSDTPQIVGSFAKIHADTGWAPIINLRQSLNDSLKEWKQKWGM